MRKSIIMFAALAAVTPATALLAKPVDDVAIGTAFVETCVKPAPDGAAVRAGIAANPAWVKTDVPADFALKPKAKAATLEGWRQAIDGREILLVLISEPQSKGLQNNCAFVLRDDRSAMWYFRSVSDKLKAFGLKLNQQDIPHWRYHKGKFATGQRGEVELRSKSAALPGKDVLHLAIAY